MGFLEGNKERMQKWMRGYMANKGHGGSEAAAVEMDEDEFDEWAEEEEEEFEGRVGMEFKGRGRRRQKRHKEQINGVTKHTSTLSPRQSLMLIVTLFFVIIASCLV